MSRIRHVFASSLARFRAGTPDDVHFHRGPQGQPVPCFDERCQMPRLSV